jgi:hypothetical protein
MVAAEVELIQIQLVQQVVLVAVAKLVALVEAELLIKVLQVEQV